MAGRTVVFDSNVYVSALVFGGKPKRAVQLGIARRVDVAISDSIRDESPAYAACQVPVV